VGGVRASVDKHAPQAFVAGAYEDVISGGRRRVIAGLPVSAGKVRRRVPEVAGYNSGVHAGARIFYEGSGLKEFGAFKIY
jgi:hypothetical protein